MASRSPAQIEAQKAAALARARSELQGASQTASIESTPPGYITGFKVVLTPEYKIDIYPGVLNVGGLRVELGAKYTLRPEDEMMARLSKSWWYLYVDKLGAFYADVIPPEFKPEWMAYYHKNHPWRNIGRYFVCDDHLCRYAANWQQASEQTVYVAPANFGGIANYYCTGVDDQILINAAIRYLLEAYDGGVLSVLRGQYFTTAAIEGDSGIAIEFQNGAVITKNCNDYAVECVGTSGTHKSNFRISGGGRITRASTDTYSVELVHLEYTDDSVTDGITVDNSYEDGIYIINCTNGKVEGGVKISSCAGTGLKIIASTVIIASAITIVGCAIGCEMWPSIDIDKMSHGDCESTDEPMLDNETTPRLDNSTWARSSAQAHSGTYSYLHSSAGGAAIDNITHFVDNLTTTDMHGATAGKTYRLSCWAYVLSAATTVAENCGIGIGYYLGASYTWEYTWCKPIYDAWQKIDVIVTIPASATGVYARIYTWNLVSVGSEDILYLDDIHFYEFDETDSGCQLVNSSIYSCTDTGVSVANSDTIIQNNQINTNTSNGIVIQAGYRSIVTANRCYNNGSDTDIANTNGNNFYDAGTDTQVYSNSWQQPVAGEPTQGELKWLPQSTSTVAGFVLNGVTTTAGWASCSLSSLVPIGSKTIKSTVYVYATSSATGLYNHFVAFSNSASATAPAAGTYHPVAGCRAYSTAGAGESAGGIFQIDIPITDNRKFYYYGFARSNATNCIVYLALNGYTV